MEGNSDDHYDPLFVGATRPTMKWGVTYEAMIVCLITVGILFIGINNALLILLYIPLHGTCYVVCLKEPRFFRIIFLWVNTKCKSVSWRVWGAATASPLISTRKNNKRF
jgi:type IV secretion system protein VirB3